MLELGVSCGARRAAWRPQRPSSLTWALPPCCASGFAGLALSVTRALGQSAGLLWLWGRFRGIPEGCTPVHRQRRANLPPGSFLIPRGQSVWETGWRPLTPALMAGRISHVCGWTLTSPIHSAEARSKQSLGMGLFCSPGTAGAVPAVWPQRGSQHVTEEHVVKLGDFIILRP